MHEGELYEVLKLDLESRTAYGVPLLRKLLYSALRNPGDQDPSDFLGGGSGKEPDPLRRH